MNDKLDFHSNGVNILSLFDGMCCGMLAFQSAGVPVKSYTAYEIDKYAIQTATHNFPEIKECGDVFAADFSQYKDIDYLIGGSPCFTKGHFVLTDKGYKDISEIKVGDYVLTHTGAYKKVIRTNQRDAEIYDLKVMGYPTFHTTANHPFYTIKRDKCSNKEYSEIHSWRKFSDLPKWTDVKDLSTDHFCGQHIFDTNGDNEYAIDEEFAYILGRYVADGHIRKTKRKGRKDSYLYQVVLSIGASKLDKFKERITLRNYSCYEHTQSVYRCVFSSMDLLNFIEEHGFGTSAYTKCIPEFVFNLPKNIQTAFLEGYTNGDGCYIEMSDEYSLSTISPCLAFGLQRLITSIYQTSVTVRISDNNRYHEIDGREIKSNYPLYTILFKKGLRKQSVAHIQNNILWTQVKSVVETDRIETVYNIEVEEDNSYTVNNCIVHNCTYWSIAQSSDRRETTASGIGWELFSQYVRALREVKPKYFIYENNKSMSQAIRDSITKEFGFDAICINSALVSAQNRQRLYWVGKRNDDGTYSKVNVEQPEDRGILLKDILNSPVQYSRKYGVKKSNDKSFAVLASDWRGVNRNQMQNAIVEPVGDNEEGKAFCLTSRYYKGFGNNPGRSLEKHRDTMVAEPVNITKDGKSQTIKAQYQQTSIANICCYTSTYGASGVAEPVVGAAQRGRYNENDEVEQTFEVREDEKSNCVTTVNKDCMVAVGVDSPKQVRSLPRPNGELSASQAFRIYDVEGKSVTINANGGGAGGKTGLYAVDIECRGYAQPCEWDENGIPTKAISGTDGKKYIVYEVKDGKITIKDKIYPIKLKDGYYIIRKLTVTECMRLQTVPEWYEFPVSDSQAYRMLGNGWTIEVIAHLIKATLQENTQ